MQPRDRFINLFPFSQDYGQLCEVVSTSDSAHTCRVLTGEHVGSVFVVTVSLVEAHAQPLYQQ